MIGKHLREPISIPRWVLTVKYGFFLILAALTAARGMVTLDLTTPDGYTPIWSVAIAAGALIALPASTNPEWERVERWGAAWIAGWLSVVAVNAAVSNNGAGWLFIALVTCLPAGRAIALFSKRPA